LEVCLILLTYHTVAWRLYVLAHYQLASRHQGKKIANQQLAIEKPLSIISAFAWEQKFVDTFK